MAELSKVVKVRSARLNKQVEYKQQSNVAFQLLYHAQYSENSAPIEELLKYTLTPVPASLGNADGSFAKTDKSKGMHHILKGTSCEAIEDETIDHTLIIEVGNELIHSIVFVPETFQLISESILKRLPKKSDIL